MNSRDFLRLYGRSPYGIASVFAAFAAGGAAGALGLGFPGGIGVGAVVLAASLALGLATGFGPRAAASELEREARGRNAERLAAASKARAALAALRLPAGEVAAARDLVVLESGRLAESFARSGAYDPEAAQAALDSLELVNAWLRERDEAATERRFELPDANPFPEAAARTAAALRDKAALIAAGRARASGEIPPADRMAIEEELK